MHGNGTLVIPAMMNEEDAESSEIIRRLNSRRGADTSTDSSIKAAFRRQSSFISEATKPSSQPQEKKAIARDNLIVCFQDEIIPGRQIEFLGPLSGIRAAPFSTNTDCIATVLKHVPRSASPPLSPSKTKERKDPTEFDCEVGKIPHQWIYLMRFHEDIWPREREIDLEVYSHFKLLREKPLIYDLSMFSAQNETRRIDDFRTSLPTITQSPLSPLALKNKNYRVSTELLPKFPTRGHSERLKSVFEARAAGIGAAAEEEHKERLKQQQKEQWAKLIEERRAAFEEARRQRIEAEQQQLLTEALASQKMKTQQRKEEEAAFLAATQAAVEQELESLGSKMSIVKAKS